LLLNGKIEFSFWVAIGDDFDVTKWMFADLPIALTQLPSTDRKQLLGMVPELKAAVEEAVQYKLNAGKRVGNYNLAKCRPITDKSDALLARAFGLTVGKLTSSSDGKDIKYRMGWNRRENEARARHPAIHSAPSVLALNSPRE
jgi:hypothetical protein